MRSPLFLLAAAAGCVFLSPTGPIQVRAQTTDNEDSDGNGQENTYEYLNPDTFPPTCGGCYCIPEDDSACPEQDTMPATTFPFTRELSNMVWNNPIELDCNPYVDSNCTLTDVNGNPAEGSNLGTDAFCGIRYGTNNDAGGSNVSAPSTTECKTEYWTKSFATRQELEEEGYVLTHLGACGACSSTQDLAVYIETPDLQSAGQSCGVLALTNESAALDCYVDVGFTRSCAVAWLYGTTNTRENCLNTCLDYLGLPPNLDQPTCTLNDCIWCDEVSSGPIFKRFAARTRRGSGLLSMIVRNCSEIVYDVVPLDPCPEGYWEEGVSSDPSSSAGYHWLLLRQTFATVAGLSILLLLEVC